MIADIHYVGNRHSLCGTVILSPYIPARSTPLGAHTTCAPSSAKGVHRWVPTLRATLPLTKWGIILATYTLVTLTCISTATAADNQGRLFFTPQQRSQLDYEYARKVPTDGNSSPVLTVNGIVQKQGGPRTVWINGVTQGSTNTGEINPTTQTVAVPGKSKSVKLKVGEKVLLEQPTSSAQDSISE